MAIGTRYGTNRPSGKERLQSYKLSQMLYREFELKHGSVYCRELVHYDLSDPEELEKARSSKVFEEKCPFFVRTVIEILSDLNETKKSVSGL